MQLGNECAQLNGNTKTKRKKKHKLNSIYFFDVKCEVRGIFLEIAMSLLSIVDCRLWLASKWMNFPYGHMASQNEFSLLIFDNNRFSSIEDIFFNFRLIRIGVHFIQNPTRWLVHTAMHTICIFVVCFVLFLNIRRLKVNLICISLITRI